jgi:hypothetical protein
MVDEDDLLERLDSDAAPIEVYSPTEPESVLDLMSDDDLALEALATFTTHADYARWSTRRLQNRADVYVRMLRNRFDVALGPRLAPVLRLSVASESLPAVKQWLNELKLAASHQSGALLLHSPYEGAAAVHEASGKVFEVAVRDDTGLDVRVCADVDPVKRVVGLARVGFGVVPARLTGPASPSVADLRKHAAWIARSPPPQHLWLRAMGEHAPLDPVSGARALEADTLTAQSVQLIGQLAADWRPPPPPSVAAPVDDSAPPRRRHLHPVDAVRTHAVLLYNAMGPAGSSDLDVVVDNLAPAYVEGVSAEQAAPLALNMEDGVEAALHDVLALVGYRNLDPVACEQVVQDSKQRMLVIAGDLGRLNPARRALQQVVTQATQVTVSARLIIHIQCSLLDGPQLTRRDRYTLFGPPLNDEGDADEGGLVALFAAQLEVPASVLLSEVRAMLTAEHLAKLTKVRLMLGKSAGKRLARKHINDQGVSASWPHTPPEAPPREAMPSPSAGAVDATPPPPIMPLPPSVHRLEVASSKAPSERVSAARHDTPGQLASALGIKLPEAGARLDNLRKTLVTKDLAVVNEAPAASLVWFVTRAVPVACQLAARPPANCEEDMADPLRAYLCDRMLPNDARQGFQRVVDTLCHGTAAAYEAAKPEALEPVVQCHALMQMRRVLELDARVGELLLDGLRRHAARHEGTALRDDYERDREAEKQRLLARVAGMDGTTRAVVRELKARSVDLTSAL